MAFNNIPPNGFPALPDVEDLEAVEKDVTTLKSSVLGLTQDVTDLNEQKANQITIAPFFNSETAYDIGDLVYYNGLTYRCTNAHEGEWDADDFTGTTIANELDTLKSGLTNVGMTVGNIVNQAENDNFDGHYIIIGKVCFVQLSLTKSKASYTIGIINGITPITDVYIAHDGSNDQDVWVHSQSGNTFIQLSTGTLPEKVIIAGCFLIN